MSHRKCTLVLDELICEKVTGEPGHDEIYFKIWIDGTYKGTYPENADESNTFDMNDGDDKYRKVALNYSLEYGDNVKIEVREQDKAKNPDSDEVIGDFTIHTSDIAYGDTNIHSNTVSGCKARYKITWRLISQKIPTLRILGIGCEQSSANCNKEVIDAVAAVASDVLSATSQAIGKVKTPKAEVMSEAFGLASDLIQGVAKIGEWIANAAEGDDDVYLQQTYVNDQSHDGAGFCPPNGGVIEMDKGDSNCFIQEYGRYFRFPLDKGPIVIEIREKDVAAHDVSLGSLTVDISDFEDNQDNGAMVAVLRNFLDHSGGQGAIYKLCYSFAIEDWSLTPNQDA